MTETEDEKINTKRLKGTLKKECKNVQQDWEQEVVFKSGLILDQHSSKRLFKKIKKITSSWAKALILRFIHGDQKYNSKLFKSNYADSPMCDSCDEIETFEHCYITCKRLKPTSMTFKSQCTPTTVTFEPQSTPKPSNHREYLHKDALILTRIIFTLCIYICLLYLLRKHLQV